MAIDHCRIGSLENQILHYRQSRPDHCRIGSLESKPEPLDFIIIDHCRIGSLEMVSRGTILNRSLITAA